MRTTFFTQEPVLAVQMSFTPGQIGVPHPQMTNSTEQVKNRENNQGKSQYRQKGMYI